MLLQCNKDECFTNSEKAVVDYINSHIDEVIDMTRETIADRTFVSAATVTRAMRKCGIERMSELRNLVLERSKYVQNVLDESYLECIEILENINVDALKSIVCKIREANRIHLIAKGREALAAQVLAFHLTYENYDVCVQNEEIWRHIGEFFQKGDFVIVFVHDDVPPNMVELVQTAKEKGITIAICGYDEKEVLKGLSDITVVGKRQRHQSTESQLGLQLVVRMIVEYLALEE